MRRRRKKSSGPSRSIDVVGRRGRLDKIWEVTSVEGYQCGDSWGVRGVLAFVNSCKIFKFGGVRPFHWLQYPSQRSFQLTNKASPGPGR